MRRFRNWRVPARGASEPDLCLEEAGSRQCGEPVRARGAARFGGWRGYGRERETAKLYAKIGQLTVARDFLAKEARRDERARSKKRWSERGRRRRPVGAPPMRAGGRGRASGVYRLKPAAGGAGDLVVMRRIDELHLELPFYGSSANDLPTQQGKAGVNRKRVRRLMRVDGESRRWSAPRHEQSRAAGKGILCPGAALLVPGRGTSAAIPITRISRRTCSRRMTFQLNKEGRGVNGKRVHT